MAALVSRPSFNSEQFQTQEGRIQVPNLVTDPTWSLCPWPVEVSVRGQAFTIPDRPAAWWLALLWDENMSLLDLFPGALDEADQEVIYDLMIDGHLALEDIQDLCLDIISLATGRKWWIALRLVGILRSHWATIGGEMLYRGMDASRMSLSGWLDVALLLIMRTFNKSQDATMFSLRLEQPPPGVEAEVEPDTMTEDAFMAMAASVA